MTTDYYSYDEYKAKNENSVLFFFPAGFTKMWHYRFTIWQLNRMGITVVGFNFAWRKAIREFDFNDLESLVYDVESSVKKIQRGRGATTRYSVFGTSFGSVLALHVAKNCQNVTSVILNVPYGTLSHLLWTHTPSKPFIETLKKDGIQTEKDLQRLTKPIETQYQLSKLKGKKIVNFTAQNDKIVFDGNELVASMKKNGLDVTLHETKFGHFWGAVENILTKSKWERSL